MEDTAQIKMDQKISLLPDTAGMFPWSPGGKICLELIIEDIMKNSRVAYAKENLYSHAEVKEFIKDCPGQL